MRLTLATLLCAAALAPALAQTPPDLAPPSTENGRYQMTSAANGFLRLDTRTGAVSLCTIANGGAECRAAADDRAALMAEIDRLAKRNAELDSGSRPARPLAGLPPKEEFGRAMDMAEDFMRRMMRVMRDETKDRN